MFKCFEQYAFLNTNAQLLHSQPTYDAERGAKAHHYLTSVPPHCSTAAINSSDGQVESGS